MSSQYILDAPDSEDGAEMQAILDNLKELIADVDDAADNSEDQSPADAMPATAATTPSENRSRPHAGQIEERSGGGLEIEGRKVRGVVPYGIESRDMGGWKEIIEPTAFHQTRFDELRAVIDHKGVPLGTYPRTLQIENRSDGLHWSLDPPKSRQDVIEAIERGDMSAGSWRMKVSKDHWQGDTRHVDSISDLYDVTITGAELPAYPAAQVEYRSQPAPGQEEPVMADQAEDRSGLDVQSVEVLPTKRDLFQELAVASRETHPGEIRSLTTSVSLATPEYSVQFFDVLRPTSAFLRSGVRTISTSNEAVIFPYLTADSTIGWVSEGGTITASDPTLAAGTATPHKLACRVEYSNELAEDSSPALETVLRQALVARAGIQVDIAAYQGSGASPTPTGMGNVSGIGNVSAAAANTSIAWAGSAIAFLESGYAPRPYLLCRRHVTCQGHQGDQGRHRLRPVPVPSRQRGAPNALRRGRVPRTRARSRHRLRLLTEQLLRGEQNPDVRRGDQPRATVRQRQVGDAPEGQARLPVPLQRSDLPRHRRPVSRDPDRDREHRPDHVDHQPDRRSRLAHPRMNDPSS